MTTNCKLCTRELDAGAVYCKCGGHFHADCLERHQNWCPRTGGEPWLGAVER